MAKIILLPCGNPINLQNKVYQQNMFDIEKLEKNLEIKREEIKKGWGDKYIERVHSKDKMTIFERIYKLIDNSSRIYEIQTFANYKKVFEGGKLSPSAGVVTAFIKVDNKIIIVVGNDNTVASGAWWPKSPEKIIRAQKISLKLRIPILYLVDCSGLYLPEQSRSFPGHYGAGHIFKMNSLLSSAGVPQISGVFGDCIAGGGYMPIISDKVFMTEKAYMVIAGAALIQGAKGQKMSSLDIGGVNIHVHLSNCADYRASSEKTCLDLIRKEISKLPSSAINYYRGENNPTDPKYLKKQITGIISIKEKMSYDIYEIIARIVDSSLFWEILPNSGKEVVVGIGCISGLYVGIVANVQNLIEHPNFLNKKRAGGILYKEGVKKIALFSRCCNDDGIPLIWLQDISGFDVGEEAEKEGLLGYGSSLIYANSTNTVPMITILLRKASGAGYYAMSGMPYEPVLQLSTVASRLSVMEGKTLALGTYSTQLDENYEIKTKDKQKIKKIKEGMKRIEERIEEDMDPYVGASRLDTDEIIKCTEIREYLECIIQACYQTTGYRRVKNPRIWSLHDL